jgi:hypothetical protein
MLRRHLQQGRAAIPKSTRSQRIGENFDIFDFELTDSELTAVDGLDTRRRGGPQPADITLPAFGRPTPRTEQIFDPPDAQALAAIPMKGGSRHDHAADGGAATARQPRPKSSN